MTQNYEVHIDGKPFFIGERPEFIAMPVGWLAIRVDLPSEMNYLAALLTARPELKGMHVFGADVEQLWDWFRADYRFVEVAAGHWLPETVPSRVAAEILDRVRRSR